jgi:hypothetical protein
MQELISQAEYARRLGVRESTVSRQVKSGVIPTVKGKIDPAAADVARAANLDPSRGRRKTALPADSPEAPPVAPDQPKTVPITSSGLSARELMDARVRKERALARLRELEAQIAEGSLVALVDVIATQKGANLNVRDRLLSFPGDMGPRLASEAIRFGLTDERALGARLSKVILEQVHQTLNLLADYRPPAEKKPSRSSA